MIQGDFKETTIIQFQWLVYYNTYTVIILVSSYMMKNEVCKIHDKFVLTEKFPDYKTHEFFSQGLKTSRIVHDIVNGCNDPDVAASV